MCETITAAAVMFDRKIYSVPRPGRHCDALKLCFQVNGDKYIGQEECGFVTSFGRYVSRLEAKEIARASGQLLPRASPLPELFSEDVW